MVGTRTWTNTWMRTDSNVWQFIHRTINRWPAKYIHLVIIIMCVYFVGLTYFTIVALYCYFWFLYTLHLFLRVVYPMKMIKLEKSKHLRKLYVVEITFAVLLAVLPNIVFAINLDFRITTFPPFLCMANPNNVFYGTIIPTIMACCATLMMMLFILYNIHIVSCYHIWLKLHTQLLQHILYIEVCFIAVAIYNYLAWCHGTQNWTKVLATHSQCYHYSMAVLPLV